MRALRSRFAGLAGIAHFVPLSAAALMLGVAMSFTAPYLSLFGVEAAAMSPFLAGVFMTLIAASGVVASTWAGRWSDRRDRHRPLLVVSLAAAALGFALLCVLRAPMPVIAAGTILLGAGAVSLSQIFSFARAVLPADSDAQRELALAALRTMLSAAWVFGPALGALMLAQTGFTGLFLAASAGFVACAVIVARIPEPTRRPAAAEAGGSAMTSAAGGDPAQSVDAAPGAVAPRAVVLRTLAALMLIGLAANATMIVLPLYIVRGLGGTPTNVSAALGLAALLEIPMMLWLGVRSTRLDKARWLTGCAAVHAAYFAGLAAVTRVEAILPLQLLSACVVAITSCLGMTRVCDLMPTRSGTATAMFFSTARVGSIVAGVLSGAFVDLCGYRATFAGCGALALVALALLGYDARDPRAGATRETSATDASERPRSRFDAPH
ncbi:sugar efflux transporter [Burkholderia humptydooensis]|uniref:Sugar efflux transporter n=2 Tax=Burkholderia humptydooensis TaxID=430531 RepID=A0A7U4P7E1_9BURK|nr:MULTISPECIES: sugar efflux transporter [Burkholderia]AJY43188.1 major Facilitator Superfamily protein [Burkholderia sp. 2002721687]ALX44360.1 MFS transporter [Burkholderia humptydooensis]EIP87622.1 major facilitator superfamily MFS_1 [Burkholderia humptydooensis MSMB43]QPS45329.1 sugar efflux transporter [Burkholderia humptydooensis]